MTLNAKAALTCPNKDFFPEWRDLTGNAIYKSDKIPLEAENRWNDMLIRLIKLVLFLAVVGLIGLTGFSFFGDMAPRTAPQSSTVTLDGG
ncbi:hypothetical protein MUY35_06825 [Aliiroseovarius sp. S1339]|uniref:hypothetical protein n=1 Tax=Aliiroseovarius sp. S1339 TaxID=2936990 RepID=UPI0020BD6832|nr:hypothetical protein [Aliiroseovarius sp. S1339]MCK8463561.1 hypothetical protein [Aliiroseovarius sp. S1339]